MIFLKPKTYNPKPSGGQATLALVFLIGGTVILVAATLAFLVFNFVHATYGYQAANRALAVALAGANDGLLQLVKNRNFNVSGSCIHTLTLGEDTANVEVLQSDSTCSPDDGLPLPPKGQAYINSDASVLGRRRRIEMKVSINRGTGEVRIISLKQKLEGYGGVGCQVSC